MKFTIGTDAEVMVEKNEGLVSAIPILQKQVKLPYGKLFFDNVLAEFTVKPARSANEFVKHIGKNLKSTEAFFKKKSAEVYFASSAHYPQRELEHPEAKRFGCSPDYDAYRVCVNTVSSSAAETTLRSAGAHVHFANPVFKDAPYKVIEMVKMMDLFLGIPSLVLDDTPEAQERRKLYGKAGAHRQCPEHPGGEYRTLSNFWIKSPELIKWVYKGTEKALGEILAGNTVTSIGFDESEICDIINTGDVKRAKRMCKLIEDKLKFNPLGTYNR